MYYFRFLYVLPASCHVFGYNQHAKYHVLHRWSPDAIVFNSWQHYGCPNYWMLHFFKDSSGGTFHPTTMQISNYDQMVASAITWQSPKDKSTYLKIKVHFLFFQVFSQKNIANQLSWNLAKMTKINNRFAGCKLRQQSRGSQHNHCRVGERHQELWFEENCFDIRGTTRRELLPTATKGGHHTTKSITMADDCIFLYPVCCLMFCNRVAKFCRWRRCRARWPTPSSRWVCQ